jgi:hypothetical protein
MKWQYKEQINKYTFIRKILENGSNIPNRG